MVREEDVMIRAGVVWFRKAFCDGLLWARHWTARL